MSRTPDVICLHDLAQPAAANRSKRGLTQGNERLGRGMLGLHRWIDLTMSVACGRLSHLKETMAMGWGGSS